MSPRMRTYPQTKRQRKGDSTDDVTVGLVFLLIIVYVGYSYYRTGIGAIIIVFIIIILLIDLLLSITKKREINVEKGRIANEQRLTYEQKRLAREQEQQARIKAEKDAKLEKLKLMQEIDKMNGYDFEKHINAMYEVLGYSVEHTSRTGDHGADLILVSKDGERTAVQVKRYSSSVTNKAVQEVVASKAMYNCTKGVVVTNSHFTDGAIKLARANNIELVGREELADLIKTASLINENREKKEDKPILQNQLESSNHNEYYKKNTENKQREARSEIVISSDKQIDSNIDFEIMEEKWVVSTTLGGKEKRFLWKIDDASNLYIKRGFKLKPEIITNDELNKINEYMKNGGWKDLANNVEKLYNGTEVDGIGKFMYSLNCTTTYAQLSSQLSAIFSGAGVWDWNGKERGMKFLLNSGNWGEKTSVYYNNLLTHQISSKMNTKFFE